MLVALLELSMKTRAGGSLLSGPTDLWYFTFPLNLLSIRNLGGKFLYYQVNTCCGFLLSRRSLSPYYGGLWAKSRASLKIFLELNIKLPFPMIMAVIYYLNLMHEAWNLLTKCCVYSCAGFFPSWYWDNGRMMLIFLEIIERWDSIPYRT